MKTVTDQADRVREIPHIDVPMPDGCRLGARIWMPENADTAPVPAILEYIPYRKNDLCAPEDHATGTYLAQHGYAYVRVDLRGAGDSEGLMPDEYLPQELQDGCDTIAWIAEQPWCDGGVGMIGISWGGFNGLQVAALRPPALKAVITACSTDDRYADDIHYMGGCLLTDHLSWASQMFARNSLPPDPQNRQNWREQWRQRLDGSGLWLQKWLEHQHRDAFWQHGSVCEDYTDIEVPVYAVGGWADGYCRAVFRLCENLPGPRKGLVGQWAHKYPHVADPGPAIGWLQETLRWWDHWLKGRDTGIMDEPMLRHFLQDHAPPAGSYETRDGRWIAEPAWPSPNITRTAFHLHAGGSLGTEPEPADAALSLRSPVFSAAAGGKWCSYAVPGDQPVDQRIDAGGALHFETEALPEAIEIAGDPALEIELSADRPIAQIAARLTDIAPDGAATRVSYGVLNLTHRDSHEHPERLEPGRRYRVRVPLKVVAQRFRADHRIGLDLSSTYFPLIWPAPEAATLTVWPGASMLDLPVRRAVPEDADLAPFSEPETGVQLEVERLAPSGAGWRTSHDLATGQRTLDILDGAGTYRLAEADITVTKRAHESYSATGDDLLSVSGSTSWEMRLARGDWSIRTLTRTVLTSTPSHFHVRARIEAFETDELFHDREWHIEIARDLV